MAGAGGRRHGKQAAIYTRYSKGDQQSTGDQVRECLAWCKAEGLTVGDDMIFSDEGETGRLDKNRSAYQCLLNAIAANEVDVVVFFATSRLYRKLYKAMMFVEERIVERGLRAVFVSQNLDTAKTDNWRLIMTVLAITDEMQSTQNVHHIRASHITKVLNGELIGHRTFGYTPVAVEGKLTRKGRPCRLNNVCKLESIWVVRIFEWFAYPP